MKAQLSILIVLAGVSLLCAQEAPPRERRTVNEPEGYRGVPAIAPSPIRPLMPAASSGVPPFSDYIIGPQDLIAVGVLDAPEFSRPVRVGTAGTIRLPLMKSEVLAVGKTASALEKDIAKALVDDGLLREPSVSVMVQEFNSKPVMITGAVRSPTIIQAVRPVTLLEAISRAGGLAENAGTEILISKPGKNGSGKESNAAVIRVPARALLDGGESSPEILLHGGEEVRVPVAARVYLLGGVNKPGALLINNEEPLTVLRAVSLSGGVLPSVGSKAYLLRTTGPGDAKTEIALNLQRIMRHREPDPLLQANDVIFVPDSKTKKLKEAGATVTVQALVYAMAGAIVWR